MQISRVEKTDMAVGRILWRAIFVRLWHLRQNTKNLNNTILFTKYKTTKRIFWRAILVRLWHGCCTTAPPQKLNLLGLNCKFRGGKTASENIYWQSLLQHCSLSYMYIWPICHHLFGPYVIIYYWGPLCCFCIQITDFWDLTPPEITRNVEEKLNLKWFSELVHTRVKIVLLSQSLLLQRSWSVADQIKREKNSHTFGLSPISN